MPKSGVGMLHALVTRWPFIAAVALAAAATSDVLVESFANTGAFGRSYFDTDDASIIPVLIAAGLFAVAVIGLHVYAVCRRGRDSGRGWLAAAARDIATHTPLRDFPAIGAMQFAALFAMESAEQLASTGRLSGGLVWLGGPVVASVCAHLFVGAALAWLAGRSMRALVASVASLVSIALDFVLCALRRSGDPAFFVSRDARSSERAQSFRVRRISGRAPPSLLAPA